ncbi:MAG: hypothetical protein JRJ23_06975 [Deltaproteobacteria bacterium]|nr:hypothetical protein [Deltaproteobacteria bacterium]MBW1913635.1 hypothetical protein [Deltaproteobacteria bacterium]
MKKSGPDDMNILRQLEELANGLGIEVRYEKIKKEASFFPGGLCNFKGDDLLIVHSKISARDKIHTLSKALATFDLGDIFVKPTVRELLLKYTETGSEEDFEKNQGDTQS